MTNGNLETTLKTTSHLTVTLLQSYNLLVFWSRFFTPYAPRMTNVSIQTLRVQKNTSYLQRYLQRRSRPTSLTGCSPITQFDKTVKWRWIMNVRATHDPNKYQVCADRGDRDRVTPCEIQVYSSVEIGDSDSVAKAFYVLHSLTKQPTWVRWQLQFSYFSYFSYLLRIYY